MEKLVKKSSDVIKMKDEGKKTPKKRWIIPHLYDVTC